ncbi:MAG TPA: hypothetical protein VM848_01670 [Acidimicrobiia bacterium]|nr:hypothetical protein [Acidimicrobiia bacterium]
MRSVSPSQWSALRSLDVACGFLDCRLKCCRFRTIEDRTQWAREHSLRTRVAESADLAGLPPTMRAARQVDAIHAARASLVMVNTALRESGHSAIPSEHVENHLVTLEQLAARHQAA